MKTRSKKCNYLYEVMNFLKNAIHYRKIHIIILLLLANCKKKTKHPCIAIAGQTFRFFQTSQKRQRCVHRKKKKTQLSDTQLIDTCQWDI